MSPSELKAVYLGLVTTNSKRGLMSPVKDKHQGLSGNNSNSAPQNTHFTAGYLQARYQLPFESSSAATFF